MSTLYEILANAPAARASVVTVGKMQADWEALKGYRIAVESGGRIRIDSHVMATLLSGSEVRNELLSTANRAIFNTLIDQARTKLNEINVQNSKIKAMHDGCRNQAGVY